MRHPSNVEVASRASAVVLGVRYFYSSTGEGHWIKSKNDDGDIITLAPRCREWVSAYDFILREARGARR